jgi:ssrA-binding protein
MTTNKNESIITQNKKALHDYFIIETYECGLVLTGTEIKAIRVGKVSLQDSFCYIKKGEMFINGLDISKYDFGNIFNHDPKRTRKLLLHKSEIIKINSKITKEGYTLIPLKVVIRKNLAKVDIAIAKGKKLYDKREDLKKKAIERESNVY